MMRLPFDLTRPLLDDILEAMENRNERFVVAVGGSGVSVTSCDFQSVPSGCHCERSEVIASQVSFCDQVGAKLQGRNRNDQYGEIASGARNGAEIAMTEGEPPECYPLPEWTSEAGYALREEFVRRLHAPLAARALQEALHSGRGAFRAFKDTIREYPQVERLWHRYKRGQMSDYVWAWYDALCDEWGLVHLAHTLGDEDDKTSDLLKEDFDFAPFAAGDEVDAERAIAAALQETPLPRDVVGAIVSKYRRQMGDEAIQGMVCRTIDGAFAGCIVWETDNDNGAAFLAALAVVKEWRGLGIASALLEECEARCGMNYVVSALPVTSDALEALMQKALFRQEGVLLWRR